MNSQTVTLTISNTHPVPQDLFCHMDTTSENLDARLKGKRSRGSGADGKEIISLIKLS